jgi:alpha-galactosidase
MVSTRAEGRASAARSNTRARRNEAQDSAWLAAAGADYLKVDRCCGAQDHEVAFADYGKWRDGLNAAGREVYLSLCGWHTWYAHVGDSLGNSWRIAGDGTNWGALSNWINLNSQPWPAVRSAGGLE